MNRQWNKIPLILAIYCSCMDRIDVIFVHCTLGKYSHAKNAFRFAPYTKTPKLSPTSESYSISPGPHVHYTIFSSFFLTIQFKHFNISLQNDHPSIGNQNSRIKPAFLSLEICPHLYKVSMMDSKIKFEALKQKKPQRNHLI